MIKMDSQLIQVLQSLMGGAGPSKVDDVTNTLKSPTYADRYPLSSPSGPLASDNEKEFGHIDDPSITREPNMRTAFPYQYTHISSADFPRAEGSTTVDRYTKLAPLGDEMRWANVFRPPLDPPFRGDYTETYRPGAISNVGFGRDQWTPNQQDIYPNFHTGVGPAQSPPRQESNTHPNIKVLMQALLEALMKNR